MEKLLPPLTFLHFFSTGPSLELDEFYQIGYTTFYPDKKNPETNSYFINPKRKFSNRLFHEGGINSNNLTTYPSWSEVQPNIFESLKKTSLIFYLGGEHEKKQLDKFFPVKLTDKLVNLKLLLQLIFPEFEKFNSLAIAKKIYQNFTTFKPGIETQLTLLKDSCLFIYQSYLYSEPVRFIIQSLTPLTTHDLMIQFLGKWLPNLHEYESFQLDQPSLLLEAAKEPVNLDRVVKQILSYRSKPNLTHDFQIENEYEKPILPSNIENYLKQEIVFSEKNFETRTEQIDYALAVTDAINNKETLLVEAGTGTGKTLGYLLPVMEYLRLNPGKRIIISTAMKNLQHQIFWNELDRIKRFFPEAFGQVNVSILKGKSNYICLGNLKKWIRSQWSEGLFQHSKDELLASLYLLNLASHHDVVDIETIPVEIYQRFPDLNDWIEHLRSDVVCFKGSCHHSPHCLYDLNLYQADKSQLIIVNHAKFLNLPPTLLNNTEAIIIDEADLFAGYLKSSLSVEISSWDVRKLLGLAYGKKTRQGWLTVLKSKKTTEALNSIDILLQSIESGFVQLSQFFSRNAQRKNGNIYLPEISSLTTEYELKSEINILLEPIDDLFTLITEENSEGRLKIPDELSSTFHLFLNQLEFLREGLSAFSDDYPTKTFCHYFSMKDGAWNLGKRAVYLNDKFINTIHETIPSWIFTSATLTLDGKFDHFINELGLNADTIITERVSSPFKYQEQSALVVTEWIPEFSYENRLAKEKWQKLVAGTCGYLTTICNGRTLILCTSYDQMNMIYEQIAQMVESVGIMVLKQEGSGTDVINEFFENEHSVLLGVDRLWTGVDFPGATLSQLIVVKLPFNPIDEPEMRHRSQVDKQYFWNYYNGLAKLKFRQGVGRLIRTKKDNGVVVVLDRRLMNGKNQMFIKNLPHIPVYNYRTIEETADFILRKIGITTEFKFRLPEIEPVLENFQNRFLSL